MATCPMTFSLVGEHSQGIEQDEDTADRGLREELPGFMSLKMTGRISIHRIRKKPRWFLYDYPVADASAAPRYDRCLMSEYLFRLRANATEALDLINGGRDRELEHEMNMSRFEPFGEVARRLSQSPDRWCAPELFPYAILDSLADICALLRSQPERRAMLPAGCDEKPLRGRGRTTAAAASMSERFDLHRIVRAASWATSTRPPRRTTDEAVCVSPDWKLCGEVCASVQSACASLFLPAVGQVGTGISAARLEVAATRDKLGGRSRSTSSSISGAFSPRVG